VHRGAGCLLRHQVQPELEDCEWPDQVQQFDDASEAGARDKRVLRARYGDEPLDGVRQVRLEIRQICGLRVRAVQERLSTVYGLEHAAELEEADGGTLNYFFILINF
jgi:hypothetical protein